MLNRKEIREKAHRKYPVFLRAIAAGESFFPLAIQFGKPSPSEDFLRLRSQFRELIEAEKELGIAIEWEERRTRKWGIQRFPEKASFPDEQTYLLALGKLHEVARFREDLSLIRERCPSLDGWVRLHAPKIADYPGEWEILLRVCEYFLKNPHPNLYARQLPIRIGTKCIDTHHEILRSLLDFLLEEHLNPEGATFGERFHLKEPEPLLRMRFLDPELQCAAGFPVSDLALPRSDFSRLRIPPARVMVVENKMIFLTLPPLKNTLAVYGEGKAAELLSGTQWFAHCALYYWGDMDDSGYRILSNLRRHFPSLKSLMMNWDAWQFAEDTLAHAGKTDGGGDPQFLEASEYRVWEYVRARALQVEQEQLPLCFVETALRTALP